MKRFVKISLSLRSDVDSKDSGELQVTSVYDGDNVLGISCFSGLTVTHYKLVFTMQSVDMIPNVLNSFGQPPRLRIQSGENVLVECASH